jgi:hypothetical protein
MVDSLAVLYLHLESNHDEMKCRKVMGLLPSNIYDIQLPEDPFNIFSKKESIKAFLPCTSIRKLATNGE